MKATRKEHHAHTPDEKELVPFDKVDMKHRVESCVLHSLSYLAIDWSRASTAPNQTLVGGSQCLSLHLQVFNSFVQCRHKKFVEKVQACLHTYPVPA